MPVPKYQKCSYKIRIKYHVLNNIVFIASYDTQLSNNLIIKCAKCCLVYKWTGTKLGTRYKLKPYINV